MGWLIVETDSRVVRVMELPSSASILCGRGAGADLALEGSGVSRRHLLFSSEQGSDWVADQGSRNGSFLNGRPLAQKTRLADGDCVELGGHRIRYSGKRPAQAKSAAADLRAKPSANDSEKRQDSAGAAAAIESGAPPRGSVAGTAADAKTTWSAGNFAPRWRDLRLVGRGGMGEVYFAQDTDLGQAIALKRIRPQGMGQEHILERLHAREAAIGRTIRHPNVVRVLEDGVIGGDPYLVMEWVEGRNLERELRERPYRLSERVEILRQVALGLAGAHASGVVHADLKPANVVVLPETGLTAEDFNLAILENAAASALGARPDPAEEPELLAEIARRSGLPKVPDLEQLPFVGRDSEMAFLTEVTGTARATGEARWVLLLGPQGVGKRRLISELRARFPETPVEVRGELEMPAPGAQGLWITVLPATLPDDAQFREAYERWWRMGRAHQLYLKPFLKGQEIRVIEQIVHDPTSARAFQSAVEEETGGFPGRLLEALRRSFSQGAWSASGASYRFEREKYLSQEAATAQLLICRLSGEEKGFRDLLGEIAVLGACIDFDLLIEATARESAALYYLLNHGQRAGYLRRDPDGTYRFAIASMRPKLAAGIDAELKQKLLRRALPWMMRRVEAGYAPLDLRHEVAVLVQEEGSPERAFKWYLDAVLAARDSYDRERFLTFLDDARGCYREVENARSARRLADLMEEVLGNMGRGLGGLDRLRRLPIEVRAKITDFGIACRWHEREDTTEEPRGTPRYMSPEQARRERLTPASDIYSLGILAREMLEGRHPLRDLRGRAAVAAILDGVAVSAPQPTPLLPAELRELIASMLAAAPAKRPAAMEIAASLQRFQLKQAHGDRGASYS